MSQRVCPGVDELKAKVCTRVLYATYTSALSFEAESEKEPSEADASSTTRDRRRKKKKEGKVIIRREYSDLAYGNAQ